MNRPAGRQNKKTVVSSRKQLLELAVTELYLWTFVQILRDGLLICLRLGMLVSSLLFRRKWQLAC